MPVTAGSEGARDEVAERLPAGRTMVSAFLGVRPQSFDPVLRTQSGLGLNGDPERVRTVTGVGHR
jgi:hypothetical protein